MRLACLGTFAFMVFLLIEAARGFGVLSATIASDMNNLEFKLGFWTGAFFGFFFYCAFACLFLAMARSFGQRTPDLTVKLWDELKKKSDDGT
ncbi:MAG: hypothetical protein JSW03_02270 [Candidatus Eiseniibacteriota bacterium]|nr:MAG: hypothetical protein JSW03_02270 [Candidatus Eisenbacteria bacterium]